jgi:succinyl-CoA synthetase beta subunit
LKLYEYQGKELLSKYGIPTPAGRVVSSVQELDSLKSSLKFPVVIKAQVLVGGRGKAGGIQFANDLAEAKKWTQKILGMDIKGLKVNKVLVVEKIEFAKELYCSILIDRATRQMLCMASAEGGVEIESVANEKIHKVTVNPVSGFSDFHARKVVGRMGLSPEIGKQVQSVLKKLYKAFREMDCELLEINPLAITPQGQVVAGDAKAIINDGALFRHKDLEVVEEEYTPLEREARAQNIAFIQLPGRIGVIANGAGLTMATLDALNEYGGQAGVFLDLGGTDNPEQVTRAFRLMKKADPSVMLLNMFGGITKCDTVARGIMEVLNKEGVDFPIVTRIKGTNAKEANEIFKDAGFKTANTLQEAAKIAVETERSGAKPKAAVAVKGRAK